MKLAALGYSVLTASGDQGTGHTGTHQFIYANSFLINRGLVWNF